MTANLSRVGDLDRHPPAGRRALVVSAQPADPGASPSNDKEAPIDDHAAEPRSDSGAACRELTARGQARVELTPPSPGNNRYPEFTVGGLCSGIGGLELGLERAGMRTIWQSETDPYASKVLAKHWPGVPNLGDLTAVDWSNVERPDLVCGGFPLPAVQPRRRPQRRRRPPPPVAAHRRMPSHTSTRMGAVGERARAPYSRIRSSCRRPGRPRV